MEKKEDFNVQKTYGKLATLSKSEFINSYKINVDQGLSSKQAEEKLDRYGANQIASNKPKRWYHYFFKSLLSPFNCILIGIALLLFYTDVYLTTPPNYSSIIVITVLVLAIENFFRVINIKTLLDFFS